MSALVTFPRVAALEKDGLSAGLQAAINVAHKELDLAGIPHAMLHQRCARAVVELEAVRIKHEAMVGALHAALVAAGRRGA